MSRANRPKLSRTTSDNIDIDGVVAAARPPRPKLKRSLSENVRLNTEQRWIKVRRCSKLNKQDSENLNFTGISS